MNFNNEKDSDKKGFFDLPHIPMCTDPSHGFPTHLYISPGKGYTHVCPSCGNKITCYGNNITC